MIGYSSNPTTGASPYSPVIVMAGPMPLDSPPDRRRRRSQRTIAGFQRAYSAATNQTVARSSFYDRLMLSGSQPASWLAKSTAPSVEGSLCLHDVCKQLMLVGEQFVQVIDSNDSC